MYLQCADEVYPEDLWLAVGQENVGVYKRGEAWPLEVLSYELILSFGAPHADTLCISVEERHLLFHTEQVRNPNPCVCVCVCVCVCS